MLTKTSKVFYALSLRVIYVLMILSMLSSTVGINPVSAAPDEGPGGPILVVSSAANPFGRYYAEILRAEGLNAFTATDISLVTSF